MKFQFFIKSMCKYDDLDIIYDACDDKIEEIVCTPCMLIDIIDEVPIEKIIVAVDYPYGNASYAGRYADVMYCIEMGVRQVEIPINADFILNGDLNCFSKEFNLIYAEAADEGCIVKPLFDYRLISVPDNDYDYVGDIIRLLKDEIFINSVTINSGQLADYFPENLDMCKRFDKEGIKVTTCRELYQPDHEKILSEHVYRTRLSNIQSLKMIK